MPEPKREVGGHAVPTTFSLSPNPLHAPLASLVAAADELMSALGAAAPLWLEPQLEKLQHAVAAARSHIE